jgi:hypothetical protein
MYFSAAAILFFFVFSSLDLHSLFICCLEDEAERCIESGCVIRFSDGRCFVLCMIQIIFIQFLEFVVC